MPFLQFSEQAAIIIFCSVRKLLFIMETSRVYATVCIQFPSIYCMINSTTRQSFRW